MATLPQPRVEVLEFLLMATLSVPLDSPAYARESLFGYAAAANDRILDGVSYSNGEGVLSAGMLFSDPSGFFANTRLSAFTGNGQSLPNESLLALDTSIGWQFNIDEHAISALLLDYRLSNGEFIDYQGAGLRYEHRAVSVEVAVEPERYYFNPAYDSIATYDARRASFEWRDTLGDVQWYAGAGWLDVERVPGHLKHVAAGTLWQWHGFDWQAGVVRAWYSEDTTADDEGTHVYVSVTRSFRWL